MALRFLSGWSGLLIATLGLCPASLTRAESAPQPIASAHSHELHTFSYAPASGEKPQHVYVAGDFNNWATQATPMQEVDGRYQATVSLGNGIHYYKFVVDGRWVTDPNDQKDLEIDDAHGGQNSAVMIGLDGRKIRPPKPNTINASVVAFEPGDVKDCNVASTKLLRLSIRAQAGNLSSAAVLVQIADGSWQSVPMWKTETELGLDRFGTVVNTLAPAVHYLFELKNGSGASYIAGGKAYAEQSSAQPNAYTLEMKPTFLTPDWAKHAVWYQIFPERFRNGEAANDPRDTKKWTSKWFSTLPGETPGKFYNQIWDRRYGGDIQGIRQELPYLRQLGINAIYLNPIFQAESLHKYDATDYRHIEEHFGFTGDIEKLQGETDDPATWQWTASDKLFLDFVADAHRQGFKVIIDGVFNHVGRPFWAFQDVIRNGKNSKYAGWFDIIDWNPGDNTPFHYRAWDKDNGSLPAFKKDPVLGIVHGPREHIFAIAKRWLAPDGDASRGVDGYRLDAPENVPHPFWVDFRRVVKETKPDAYIDGEIWSWAQPWLEGDQFDAVMNYQFAIPCQQFFVDQKKAISCSTFNNRLNAVVFNYPLQAALVNQNLLASHDTDRAASMFVNPDLGYNAKARIQDNNSKYDTRKPNAEERSRMLQEVALQMTFLGAPMIYYGDEAGMWGPADPSDREPMIWKDLQPYDESDVTFDQGKFDWYQRLIAVREKFPSLQVGFFHPVVIDNRQNIYGFARNLHDQHVYVVINRSAKEASVQIKIDSDDRATRFIDWLNPASTSVQITGNGEQTGRPAIVPVSGAHLIAAQDGVLNLRLGPWGAAVLSASENASR